MLSSEGNEKGEKKKKKTSNRANQQKSNFGRAAHFFCTLLCRYFARLQRETSRNFLVTRFMQEMSCVFLFIFFPCRSFSPWWALAFLIFPPPLQNFHVFLPTKKCLLCLLSLALFVAPFLVELCWPVAYFLFFSVSLFSVFQICGHDN